MIIPRDTTKQYKYLGEFFDTPILKGIAKEVDNYCWIEVKYIRKYKKSYNLNKQEEAHLIRNRIVTRIDEIYNSTLKAYDTYSKHFENITEMQYTPRSKTKILRDIIKLYDIKK